MDTGNNQCKNNLYYFFDTTICFLTLDCECCWISGFIYFVFLPYILKCCWISGFIYFVSLPWSECCWMCGFMTKRWYAIQFYNMGFKGKDKADLLSKQKDVYYMYIDWIKQTKHQMI